MSKGGFRAFRGSAATAESYLLERNADKLDDYYREGKERTVEHGVVGAAGVQIGALSPEQFRAWMEHRDPDTDEVRGLFRQRKYVDSEGVGQVGGTPLYQETIISVDKTLSLAAAANPKVAAALEAAMGRACADAAETLHEHAVTRVGDIGQQRQVKLEQLEFTSVQHTTSRAGDPHYHRHMQILPVGFAEGRWRALDGRTLYRLAERVNAAADRGISTDTDFRRVLAEEGLTWMPGPGGGRIAEYVHAVDEHSTRRDQIAVNREALEIEWKIAHPGHEPGPRQRQAWDTYAWAQERPSKEPEQELTPEAVASRVGAVELQNTRRELYGQTAEQIDPETIAQGALEDLGRSRSAWSAADMHAAIDRRLANTYLIGDDGVPELRAAALAHVAAHSVSFLDEGVNVEGVRHYTSDQVLAVDEHLTDALTTRALIPGGSGQVEAEREGFTLSQEQQIAAEAIAGTHQLVVIQGAAGAGKTTMLQAAAESVESQGRRLLVVSPTKRGAIEAGDAIGAGGESVHAMLYRAGAHMDDEGRWVLPEQWKPQPEEWRMDEQTVLVVDEAGMLDQDTAAALHSYIDAHRVGTLVLSGDAAQLAAVGRGGYLARAASLAGVALDLTDVRRFRAPDGSIDDAYAALSLKMRARDNPETVFDELVRRGLVHVGTLAEQLSRVADTVALDAQHEHDSIVIAPTNVAAQQINHAVFDRLTAAELIDTSSIVYGRDGDPIAAGARVATRENDRELGVANRQTWTVKNVNADGRITVVDGTGHHRTLAADYVAESVQLAYAVTGHGAQGMTVAVAHTLLSDELTASGAYVGLTRGREANVLHVVGYDLEDAREQFIEAFGRENADLGLESAREQAQRDITGLDITKLDDAGIDGTGRVRVIEETRRLRDVAEEHEQAAAEAVTRAESLEHRVAAYSEQAESINSRHAIEAQQAARNIKVANLRATEQEANAAQLQAEWIGQARDEGALVVDARAKAVEAKRQAERAGVFQKRAAQREAGTTETTWKTHHDNVSGRWGGAPERGADLEKWATRAGARHPDVIEAQTQVGQAREQVNQVERERYRLIRQQHREREELRRDVLGMNESVLGVTKPLDENTATEWAQQHRATAKRRLENAQEKRQEADVLNTLPTNEAEQRIEAREQQPTGTANPTPTEQLIADMRARQVEEQEQGRHRDIGY